MSAFVRAREIAGGSEVLFGANELTDRVPNATVSHRSPVHPVVGAESGARVTGTSADGSIAPPVPLEGPLLAVDQSTYQGGAAENLAAKTSRRSISRSSGWFTCFNWTFNLGALLLLFVAWQLWGTSISQHHAQHQLQGTFDAAIHTHHAVHAKSADPTLIASDESVPSPPDGTPVAQLQIPAIDLSEYVVSGTTEGDLAKGPGHYVGTAAPGQAGNVAVAGHRTTNGAPFNRIGQLTVGDSIYLTTTSDERLTYVVSQIPQAVSPSDVAVLDNFGDNRITLTTCNPEFSSSQRLVVVGELKEPTVPNTKQVKPKPYHIVNAQTASWDWSLLPVVVLKGGVLMLLGLSYRRLVAWYGGFGRWVILVPVWAAALYFFFDSLTGFLPSTI